MISFQTYQKIQEHKAYGASMLRTSQIMGLSYNTVYKWWDLTEDDSHAFESSHEFVLDNYRQYFIEQLKVTPQMNNTLLYKRLKDDFGDEIEVPISTFHRYIKSLREQTGYVKPQRKTAMREDPEPGYEAQVDYGQYAMKSMYGNNVRVYFFCMVLSYSRMKFVYFSPEPFDAELTTFYKAITFLSETHSLVIVTNRKLSGWKDMGADRHLAETLRERLMTNAQLIHLK